MPWDPISDESKSVKSSGTAGKSAGLQSPNSEGTSQPLLKPKPEASAALSDADKLTAEMLINLGTKPADVIKMYGDKATWDLARFSAEKYIKLENQFQESQRRHENCMEFLQGSQLILESFSKSKSSELRTLATYGLPLMSGMMYVEKLWGVFSGGAGSLATKGFWGSFGAVGGFIAAGVSILNLFFGGNDNDALGEAITQLQQQLGTLRNEMHQRLDHTDALIHGVHSALASYCNSILHNQKIIIQQNQRTLEACIQGFTVVSSMLSSIYIDNRLFYDSVFRGLAYISSLQELAPVQALKESIQRRAESIQYYLQVNTPITPQGLEHLIDKLNKLAFDIKRSTSSDYNGQKEFALLSEDPQRATNFLANRALDQKNDALGFLAEEVERILQVKLIDANIDKSMLPLTSVWSDAIFYYIESLKQPLLHDYDPGHNLGAIKTQYENLIRFTYYIRESQLLPVLLKKHEELSKQFQADIFNYFNDRQKQTPIKEVKEAAVEQMSLQHYFSSGADLRTLYALDYNYILLRLFASLAGLSQEAQEQIKALDKSTTLLSQHFNCNETPTAITCSHLSDACMTVSNNQYNYRVIHDHLEKIGAKIMGASGQEQMFFINTHMYSANQVGADAACSLGLAKYDLATNEIKDEGSIQNQVHFGTFPFPLTHYKGNFNEHGKHGFASTHLIEGTEPLFVLHTGGSAYINLYNINSHSWIDLRALHANRPGQFELPLVNLRGGRKLDPTQPIPDTTCYTEVIGNRYLITMNIHWNLTKGCDLISLSQPPSPYSANSFRQNTMVRVNDQLYFVDVKKNTISLVSRNTQNAADYDNLWILNAFTDMLQVAPNYALSWIENLTGCSHTNAPESFLYGFDLHTKNYLTSYTLSHLFIDWPWVNQDKQIKCNQKLRPELSDWIKKGYTRNQTEKGLVYPNQFYFNKIKPKGMLEALVYGIAVPGDELSISFHYMRIAADPSTNNYADISSGIPHWIRNLPIAVKTIHQINSQVVKVNDEHFLMIALSVTTAKDKHQLIILTVDYFKHTFIDNFHLEAFPLESLHPISDWQALRLTVVKIGEKERLAVGLLDKDRQTMLFLYNPESKKLQRICDGPLFKFIDFNSSPNTSSHVRFLSFDADHHLESARKALPGFYPVGPFELGSAIIGGVSHLLVSYPGLDYPWDLTYKVKVMKIPLTPMLTLKPVAGIRDLLPKSIKKLEAKGVEEAQSSEPKPLLANYLAKDLLRVQLLLSSVQSPLADKHEEKEISNAKTKEAALHFEKAFALAQNIQILFEAIVQGLNLPKLQLALIQERLERIKAINALPKEILDNNKKRAQLKDAFVEINFIDALLKLQANYASGIGINIAALLKNLNEELERLEQSPAFTHKLAKQAESRPMFSFYSNKLHSFFDGKPLAGTHLKGIRSFTSFWEGARKAQVGTTSAALVQESKEYGFNCHDTERDGNCFFHAVAHQLNQSRKADEKEYTDVDLREITNNHMLTHFAYYEPFLAEFEGNKDVYIGKHLEKGTFADNHQIEALSSALGITIAIIRSDKSAPNIFKQENAKKTAYLGYDVVGIHYQSLIKNNEFKANKSIAAAINAAETIPSKAGKPKQKPVVDAKEAEKRISKDSESSNNSQGFASAPK